MGSRSWKHWSERISRVLVDGGNPNAWATPPPARSSRRLTISGGFTIADAQHRRVDQRARAHGFPNPVEYLAARCRQEASLPRMASELGTTVPVIRRLLTQAGIQRPPQAVMTAIHRRRATDQQLTQQAARLGFATLEDYLADRVVEQAWPLSQVGRELGTHLRTVRPRLDRYGLRRDRPTLRQAAGHQRATARRQAHWAAQRQARLTRLGFASLEDYLLERRVRQGWSVRRMRAELRVDKAWLKHQMTRLGIA